MLKILQNVDSKKVTQQNDIPVRITKESKLTFSNILSEMFNFYMNNTSQMDLRTMIFSLFIRKMILLIKQVIDP